MFPHPARTAGPLVCMAGLLFSGLCGASSMTVPAAMTEFQPVSLHDELLSFQYELYSFRTVSAGLPDARGTVSGSLQGVLEFDDSFDRFRVFHIHGLRRLAAPQERPAPVGPARATTLHTEPRNPPDPGPATPMPMALWILGTGMIGLSAVGRRRAQPEPSAVPA